MLGTYFPCQQIDYYIDPLGKSEYLIHDIVHIGSLCTHSICLERRPSWKDAVSSAYFIFGVRLEVIFLLQI